MIFLMTIAQRQKRDFKIARNVPGLRKLKKEKPVDI